MLRFLIGLFVAVTAAKFISSLRRGNKIDAPPQTGVVVDASPCPRCGVYGDVPCKNCR